jgi:Zn-dependent protease with chaperone function
MFGFYVLALGIVCILLYLPYAEMHYAHRLDGRLGIFAVVSAFAILHGVMPRVDRFRDPGPKLTAAGHPELFALLSEVAKATGQTMPRDVFLVPDVNAWVAQRGGIMGFGSHRVMGIGFSLLHTISPAELRAVLAHEFGHYHGGDTSLGPWLYKTRAAIERTVRNLAHQNSWVGRPFVWYGNSFLRITHGVSRQQEYAADALAAKIAGPQNLASGLARIHAVGGLFDGYWSTEIGPLLEGGLRPAIADGFVHFLASPPVADRRQDILENQLNAAEPDVYDTHPPLGARLAALGVTSSETGLSHVPAISLLSRPDTMEEKLLAFFLSPEKLSRLRAVSWQDVGTAFWVERWSETAAKNRERLAGLTVGNLPELAAAPTRLPVRLGLVVALDAPVSERQIAEACFLVAAALAARLHETGWRVEALPGDEVRFRRGEAEIRPFGAVNGLFQQKLSREEWARIWRTAGLANEDLGAPESVDADGLRQRSA